MPTSNRSRAIALLSVCSLALAGCPSSPSRDSGEPGSYEPRLSAGSSPPAASTQDEIEELRDEPIDIVPSANVGTLPGHASVDRFGQAHYSIPLAVAPGVRGMQPNLALSYTSHTSNGNLGVGFGLAGSSSISRCARSLRLDGEYEPVRFDSDDALCLDGNRLVLFSGTYGLSGSEYRTRHDSFTKVVLHGDGLSRDSWFEVFRKDGRVQRYGSPSSWLNRDEQPLVWALDREADRFDNEVRYFYQNVSTGGEQVELRLVQIRYGGTGLASTERVVDFAYGSGPGAGPDRPDVQHGFFFGVPTEHAALLETVIASGPGGDVHTEYRLEYGTDPVTGRSRLEEVQRCDRFGECMPPTVFTWKDDGTAGFGSTLESDEFDELDQIYSDLERALSSSRQVLVGDYNGDFGQSLLVYHDVGDPADPVIEWRMWSPQLSATPDLVEMPVELPVSTLPPSASATAVAAMDAWASGGGVLDPPVHLFQATMDPMVVNAGISDRLADVTTPSTAGGDTLDDAGHPVAHTLAIHQASGVDDDEDDGLPTHFDFIPTDLPNPSGRAIYSVYPLDHDGDSYTDYWICEGGGYKSGEWTLVLADKAPNDGSSPVTYAFHPSGVGCSVHDEVAIGTPDGGRRQALLVVPAYETDLAVQPHPDDPEFAQNIDLYVSDYEPTPESARIKYFTLRFDPGEVGYLESSGLPRDHYQRWHDLLCRNGVAEIYGAPPVVSSGLGHDKHVDLNGDGFVDVLRFELASGDDESNLSAIKTGLGDSGWDESPGGPHNLCDDELDDPVDAVLRVYWNTGSEYRPGPVAFSFDDVNAHATMWLDFVGAQLYDIDRDGRLDLLMPSIGDGNGFSGLISQGDGTFTVSPSNMPPDGWPAYTGNEAVGDWKEEAERFTKRRTLAVQYSGTLAAPELWFVGVEPADGAFWDDGAIRRIVPNSLEARERITDVVDGVGAHTTFDYDTDGASPLSTGSVFPRRVVTKPRLVVSKYGAQSSPGDDLQIWEYEYGEARSDAFDGEFLGYDRIARTRSFIDRVERSYDFTYDVDLATYPFADRVAESVRLTNLEGAVSDGYEHAIWTQRTPTLVTKAHPGGDSWFSYAGVEQSQTFSGTTLCEGANGWADCAGEVVHSEVTITRTLDDYGTTTMSRISHTDGDKTTTTAEDIVHDTDEWLLDQVARTNVQSCVVGAPCGDRVVETTYFPSTGAVHTSTVQPGTDDGLATTLSYDPHGNVSQTLQEDAFDNKRITTATYDAEGAFLENATNAEGHTTWYVAEPTSGALGALADPNGITSVTHFDGFFRPVHVERRPSPMGSPDGAPAQTTYLDGEPAVPNSAFRVRHDRPGGQRIFEDYGSSGHLVRSTWYGMRDSVVYGDWLSAPPGGDVVRVHWYDIRGREIGRSVPTYEGQLDGDGHAPHETAFAYDNLNREVTRTRPDGATDTWTYAFGWGGAIPFVDDGGVLTVHADADGRSDTTVTDSHGRLVRTIDGTGVHTCMTYGAFGVHTRSAVDCGSGGTPRSTVYHHDSLGRVILEDDPVSSAREYDHNGFGEVVERIDGNGATTLVERDDLGRPESIATGSEVDTLLWDLTHIGALSTSDSADGIHRFYDYDEFGRASLSQAAGFDGAYVYSTEYEYDDADRLVEITFPEVLGASAPVRASYEYDVAGYLRAIARPAPVSEPLWAAISANAPGQVMHEQFGEETHGYRSYYPETLRPKAITALHDAEGSLQSMWYYWTPAGELDHRDDNKHGQTESFEYDDARRLLEATANFGPEILTQTVSYDAYGNIEYKSDVGSYAYDTHGRLMSYGPPLTTLGYDDNGNVTTRGAQVLTYTPFEKVRTIEGGGASLEFLYDAGGERIVKEDAANGTTVLTLDGMYEARLMADGSREERYTLPTPTGSAVRIDRTVHLPLFYELTKYVHGTFQGSGGVVSRPDGSVDAEVAYDAWGAARDATNWTEPVDDVTLVELGTGFTGHPAELDSGLVNMGGRMYDPALGRFVQRDPIVANSANGADYNKFSYVRNRPLRLVDPTGYEPGPDPECKDGSCDPDGSGSTEPPDGGTTGGTDDGSGDGPDPEVPPPGESDTNGPGQDTGGTTGGDDDDTGGDWEYDEGTGGDTGTSESDSWWPWRSVREHVVEPFWDHGPTVGKGVAVATVILTGGAAAAPALATLGEAKELVEWGKIVIDEVTGDTVDGDTEGFQIKSAQGQGREHRIDSLQVNEFDDRQPTHVRGWLENERRRVESGGARRPRNPPGYVQAHGRKTPAREGRDYNNARLSGSDLNRLEESVRRKRSKP